MAEDEVKTLQRDLHAAAAGIMQLKADNADLGRQLKVANNENTAAADRAAGLKRQLQELCKMAE